MRRSVRFGESAAAGQSIIAYDPQGPGAEAYRQVAAPSWRAAIMAKKRPKINLSQPFQPRTGDLEKLFSRENDVEQSAGLQLLAVRVDAIQPDPDQPRSTFPPESLEELSTASARTA